MGLQRASGNGTRGVDYAIKPGLTPSEHISAACTLEKPFSIEIESYSDLRYAAKPAMVLGHASDAYRDRQHQVLQWVVEALGPLSTAIRDTLSTNVAQVAKQKEPAPMAFLTVLLRWHDREQPMAFIIGVHILGNLPSTHVFHPIATKGSGIADEHFFGSAAEEFIQQIERQPEP